MATPASTTPITAPRRWGGDHFTVGGTAAASVRPAPLPTISPTPRVSESGIEAMNATCGSGMLATMSPSPTSTAPAVATHRGPRRSCTRPPTTIPSIRQANATEKGRLTRRDAPSGPTGRDGHQELGRDVDQREEAAEKGRQAEAGEQHHHASYRRVHRHRHLPRRSRGRAQRRRGHCPTPRRGVRTSDAGGGNGREAVAGGR